MKSSERGDSMGGPEEIGAGVDDVIGRDFFDNGFVFVVVVGNGGAAQEGKEGSGSLASDLLVGPFLAGLDVFSEEIEGLFDAAAIGGFVVP